MDSLLLSFGRSCIALGLCLMLAAAGVSPVHSVAWADPPDPGVDNNCFAQHDAGVWSCNDAHNCPPEAPRCVLKTTQGGGTHYCDCEP